MDFNESAKLELWKRKLLDLTRRNRFLNMRFTKGGGCTKLTGPGADKLWKVLVEEEGVMRFPNRTRVDFAEEEKEYQNRKELAAKAGKNEADFKPPAPFELKKTDIDSGLSGKEQNTKLKGLRARSRSIAEERGVNALYLTFGIVNWRDEKGTHMAPLLLVPVELTLKSKASAYLLSLQGDDPRCNETLILKADVGYGVKIPRARENELPSGYIDRVQNAVKKLGWTVEATVGIGIYSFAALNMYQDLVENADEIMSNKNVRAICGDIDACDAEPVLGRRTGKGAKVPDDPERAAGLLRILDSDSTQDRAVEWAHAGASFVLQGPRAREKARPSQTSSVRPLPRARRCSSSQRSARRSMSSSGVLTTRALETGHSCSMT